jgi:hypothetical protein
MNVLCTFLKFLKLKSLIFGNINPNTVRASEYLFHLYILMRYRRQRQALISSLCPSHGEIKRRSLGRRSSEKIEMGISRKGGGREALRPPPHQ